jgi:hypothetical protein
MTDLTQAPQVEKQVTEGFDVNPEEAAFAGVEPGFTKTGEVTSSVPDVPRSTSLTVGGETLDIPLKYKQDVEAEKAVDEDRALELKQRGEMIDLPGVGQVNKALVPFFSARERVGEFGDVKVVPGGYLTPDGTFHDTTPPTPRAEPKEAAATYVTDQQGRRVLVSKRDQLAAPVGTYSDVRPVATSVRKADPAKLKMAYNALGSATTPNSLWDLSVKINTGTGMLSALKSVGKRKLTEMAPEMMSQSDDPQIQQIFLYTTALQGFASSIAKAFGESGVLTNQDIARATGLFPKVGESPKTTLIKLNRIKSVMESGLDPAGFREIFGRDVCAPGEDGTGAGCPPEGGGGGAPDGAPAAPGSRDRVYNPSTGKLE